MTEPRTKDTALNTLLSLRNEGVQEVQDERASTLLSEDLVRAVFDEAWRLQFEDDVGPFQRAVRDLVTEAVDQTHPEGPK